MSTPRRAPVAELDAPEPPADLLTPQLRRLWQKYELLLDLSRGAPGRTTQRRDAMRAIAQLFPAALREWDELPPAELTRRHTLVTALVASSERRETPLAATMAADPWLRYSLDLHDCLRAVLQLRGYLSQQAGGRLPRGPRATRSDARPRDQPPALPAEHLAVCQALVHGCAVPWLTVTPALLQAIAEPAAGRLTALAYQAVATRHGTSVATIKAALFGHPESADPANPASAAP